MIALIIRIIKQMLNDRRSIALLLLAPILIMTLMYLLLGDSSYEPKIGVNDNFPQSILSVLEKEDVTMIILPDDEDMNAKLENKEIDAMITADSQGMTIRMLEADSVKASKVTDALKSAMATINPAAGMNLSFIYGDAQASTFDNLGYILLGVMSFFIVFLLSGVSFIREQTTGTLERLMLTPIKRYEVISGYTLGFGMFAVIQSIVVVLYCQYILNMQFTGSVLLCILIMILLAFAAVATGTLISIFANNEFQVVQFIPIIIIPQIFFSGLIPVDTLPFHLGMLSYIMPIYYGCTALHDVMLKGYDIGQIWNYLAAILVFIVVLSVINTFALKKYRKM